jgi:hypothetical protein
MVRHKAAKLIGKRIIATLTLRGIWDKYSNSSLPSIVHWNCKKAETIHTAAVSWKRGIGARETGRDGY